MELGKKRVLVTGADGFIGSHLAELLVRQGAQVRALAYYNAFNFWGWLEEVECLPEIEVLSGDLRDPFLVERICEGMEVIFNLAALISIQYSYEAPASYVQTNIEGTLNLCQAALSQGCERLVHLSSSEVYGTARSVPIDEHHPLQPQSPYSATKIAADALAGSYFHAYELPVVIARPFNAYGPRQSARGVIPTIIMQLASGQREIRLGNLSPTRDFTHVSDTCEALAKLACCDEAMGRAVNIGSGFEISIQELAYLIMELMGVKAEVRKDPQRVRPATSEVQRLYCDNSLLKKLTGFAPRYQLKEGLEETIRWFSKPENLAKYKTDLYYL